MTNEEFPFTTPEGSDARMFIQWKNTKVCMDFYCQCGAHVHGDGGFAYNVECGACGAFYQLGTQVIAKRVDEPDGACLYLAHDEPDNTPPQTITLPGGQEATVIGEVAEGLVLWTGEDPHLAKGGPVKGSGPLIGSGGIDCAMPVPDSILAHLRPAEAMLPGPDGPIHIRGAYGDQPAQITQLDLDNTERD